MVCDYKHYYMYQLLIFQKSVRGESMAKIFELEPKKHSYELDQCAGCGDVIKGDYTEIGLPSGDGNEIKHIALCTFCSGVAVKEGVI